MIPGGAAVLSEILFAAVDDVVLYSGRKLHEIRAEAADSDDEVIVLFRLGLGFL